MSDTEDTIKEKRELLQRVVWWLATEHPEILTELIKREGSAIVSVMASIASDKITSVFSSIKDKITGK